VETKRIHVSTFVSTSRAFYRKAETERRQVSASKIPILNHPVRLPENQVQLLSGDNASQVAARNFAVSGTKLLKDTIPKLRLRVPLRPRGEEIRRKYFSCLFPVRFHFISACRGLPGCRGNIVEMRFHFVGIYLQ
jgi:hypothetical protein